MTTVICITNYCPYLDHCPCLDSRHSSQNALVIPLAHMETNIHPSSSYATPSLATSHTSPFTSTHSRVITNLVQMLPSFDLLFSLDTQFFSLRTYHFDNLPLDISVTLWVWQIPKSIRSLTPNIDQHILSTLSLATHRHHPSIIRVNFITYSPRNLSWQSTFIHTSDQKFHTWLPTLPSFHMIPSPE